MKRIAIVCFVIAATAVGAFAQEFNPFRVGLGLGYASPSGKGAKAGILYYIEPGYRVSDQILANLRIEGAVIARGFAEEQSAELDVAALSSYTVNGQYYFNNNNFRPFAGLGLGIYSLAAVSIEANQSGGDISEAATSKLGFYPRVGFDAGHFQFSLDYNIVPETSGVKNSYLGVRLGGFIGGGRR